MAIFPSMAMAKNEDSSCISSWDNNNNFKGGGTNKTPKEETRTVNR